MVVLSLLARPVSNNSWMRCPLTVVPESVFHLRLENNGLQFCFFYFYQLAPFSDEESCQPRIRLGMNLVWEGRMHGSFFPFNFLSQKVGLSVARGDVLFPVPSY